MKTVKIKKKKNIILGGSFIIAFIIFITVAYNSYSTTKEYFLGDTNVDNEITLSDELLLLRHIYSSKSDKNNNWRLTGDAVVNADINEDKKIDISDVLYIKRYLLAQKDKNIAEKHVEWTNLCRKVHKDDGDIVKSYTLSIKPGDKTYTGETKTTITVIAPEASYNVSFDGNGGSTPSSEKSIRNFSNWELSGAGILDDKKSSTTTYTFENSDATLTANYNKEGNSIVLPNAQKEEYVVEGWYDSEELKNKIGNVGDLYSPTQDTTLYAKWIKQKIDPTSIELNKISTILDMSNNKTDKLTAKIIPTNSNYNNKLTWKSSNLSVATVSEDGNIIGVSNGKAIITVQTENGKVSECEVTVQTSPTGISLNVTEKTIDLSSNNKTFTIQPTIIPSTANVNNSIKITTSNENVATVSSGGIVSGVSNGGAVIKFYTDNGRFATCNVKVVTSPTSVLLNKTSIDIDSDESTTKMLVAVIKPSTSSIDTKLTWKSSNPNIATVSDNGLVTGIATGDAIITVQTGNGKIASCNVSVKIAQPEPIEITLNKTAVTLDLSSSSTEKLTATSNSSESLNWSSSNINVATVSDDGVITGKSNGETTITVSNDSGVSATCDVIVQTSPTGLSLNITEQTLDMSSNTTFTLVPTVIPSTANVNREIQIKSNDSNVATISTKGVVTGKANGVTDIIFRTANGKEAKCNVTVQTSPTSITLDKTSLSIDLSDSNTQKLVATINPDTCNKYTSLTWKSSNENIATVSNDGLVTGKTTGTAKIIVETENGKSATCDVNVTSNKVEPTEITLNKEALTIDLSGVNTEKLIATTNAVGGLNWSSNNTNVATVSDDGVVTGKSNGKATITVIDSSGSIATCEVTVQTSPTSITLNVAKQTLDLSEIKTFKIEPNIEPKTANVNNKIYFESSNKSVADVSDNGEVRGITNGVTTIMVKTSNGKTANCNVTVQTSPTGVILNVTEQTLDLSGTKTFTIIPTIIPSTANVNRALLARTDNKNVATISEEGVVTGIANGTATITVETENGKSVTCNVVVQTSPTSIYFKENKDDNTKYLSIKKGESGVASAIIEPSTANVNKDIKYSISSGNTKVASINSSTGNISGKQAGVVTIKARTSNGKTSTIKLNVKIGNEAFDTYNTIKLKAKTSNDLLYSKAIDFAQNSTIGKMSHFQTFSVASNDEIYYCSYPGNKTNKDGVMNISIGKPNETPYKCMTLHYFGHGSGFDLEKGAGGGKVWIDSVTKGMNDEGAFGNGYAITRIQWANKSEYYFAAGTVKLRDATGKLLKTYENSEGENFVFSTDGEVIEDLRVAIDEKNRLMGIRKGREYYVFDLDEALEIADNTYKLSTSTTEYENCIVEIKAKDLNNIKPLTSFKIPSASSEDDVTWYAWQGFDLDGDYIYIGEGGYTNKVTPTLWDYKAFVSVFDYMYAYNGKTLAKKKTEVVAVNDEWNASKKLLALMGDDGAGNYNRAQLEGIKVTTQGGVREMYLGFDSMFKSTGKRSANILKYSY